MVVWHTHLRNPKTPGPRVSVREQRRSRAFEVRCAHCGPINLLWDKRLAMLAAADHWLGHQMR